MENKHSRSRELNKANLFVHFFIKYFLYIFMITTTSSSKSKNYIFKKLNNRCTQRVVRLENKQSLALREIEICILDMNIRY